MTLNDLEAVIADAGMPEVARDIYDTDLGNARVFVRRHGDDIRYCHPFARWLVWDGGRWQQDDLGEVERRQKEVLDALLFDAVRETEGKERSGRMKHLLRSQSAPRIRAAIDLARSEPGIAILPDHLDRDDWLFNVANGTIDLRTGDFRDHRRGDLISKSSPVRYDPDAVAPLWHRTLETVLPDADVRRYLQRLIGYALTGTTGEQILAMLYGGGANGKTTITEQFRLLLGDYAMQAPAETFIERRGDSIPNDVARLRGARLVLATELAEGRRLNEVLVKRLTGGDTITARFMRAEWFEFQPKFTPILVTNHRPEVRGTDEAIWRRIRLIPFMVTIPADERDPDLPGRLRSELSGILNWALEGCAAWQRDGLGLPDAVAAATTSYRSDSDAVGRFLDERCSLSPEAMTAAAELHAAYKQWAEANGEPELKPKTFGVRLSERGLQAHRTNSARWWIGVELHERDA